MNLYQKYLAADMVTKRVESVGLTVTYVMFHDDYANRGTSGAAIDLSIDYRDANGKWMSDADREAKVNAFLERYPDTAVTRKAEYGGKPEMLARGVTSTGIAWEINFHSGTCERVQVGTKKVERFEPEALANLKKVTVDEPIYEYVCADPIVAAGLVAA
ncbi:hypothetical protein GCM10009775_04300 [Microbacterium aoyamense]|uniref:Uncharacterized protein n=1 Tax=Microbacterium aoyamense TaxID=344166 RepID=A0ABN2P895_9MICO|nr:hypothetical protein [Microbacterium aoyamense]